MVFGVKFIEVMLKVLWCISFVGLVFISEIVVFSVFGIYIIFISVFFGIG